MTNTYIIRAKWVVPLIADPIADGAVVVTNDRIAKVGNYKDLRGFYGVQEIVNIGNAALLPGFICIEPEIPKVLSDSKLAMIDFVQQAISHGVCCIGMASPVEQQLIRVVGYKDLASDIIVGVDGDILNRMRQMTGVEPLEIFSKFTINPAMALGYEHVGLVGAAVADLVGVAIDNDAEEPLADILESKFSVVLTVSQGRIVYRRDN
ncbi:MAG: amidohydrolase family protein [Phycisphaerae bacterium]|nr:amidohydrolase family protein [Phycisphaerae bacterium]